VPCRRWSRDSLAPSPPRHRHDTAVDTPGGGVSQVGSLTGPGLRTPALDGDRHSGRSRGSTPCGHSGTAPDAGATTVHHAHTHTLPHVHSGQQRSSGGGAVRWAHTNSSSSGGGRRTQRQWRAGLPRAIATAAGHSVAGLTGWEWWWCSEHQ
jgi:hypothetical protein